MKVRMAVEVFCEGVGCDKVEPGTLTLTRDLKGNEAREVGIPDRWRRNRKWVHERYWYDGPLRFERRPATVETAYNECEVFCPSCYRKQLKARKEHLIRDAEEVRARDEKRTYY